MTHPIQGPTDEFPKRPDNIDFDILSAVVIAMDDEAEMGIGDDTTIPRMVGRFVDPDSLTYMAIQRSVRALHILSGEDVKARADELMMLISLYLDAFTAGCMYQKTRGNKNAKSGDPRKRASK